MLDDVIADGEDELIIADDDGHLVVWRAEQSTSRRRRLQVRKPKHGANMAPTLLPADATAVASGSSSSTLTPVVVVVL